MPPAQPPYSPSLQLECAVPRKHAYTVTSYLHGLDMISDAIWSQYTYTVYIGYQTLSASVQTSGGGGDGFEVQKYGDGRVALIGKHTESSIPAFLQPSLLPVDAQPAQYCTMLRHQDADTSGAIAQQMYLPSLLLMLPLNHCTALRHCPRGIPYSANIACFLSVRHCNHNRSHSSNIAEFPLEMSLLLAVQIMTTLSESAKPTVALQSLSALLCR